MGEFRFLASAGLLIDRPQMPIKTLFNLVDFFWLLWVSFQVFTYSRAFMNFLKPFRFYPIIRRHLLVEIKTVGELEAARSMIIASSIKGDLGKIINLIADGVTVQPGEVLIKMDTSPFEEKIEKLQAQIKEQEACFKALEHALEWEKSQAEHENSTAAYEVETAQLELDKIVYGDGPQETSRLKGVMQKAWLKYEELNAYSHDLMELEAQGFLNPVEVKQAQKNWVKSRKHMKWQSSSMKVMSNTSFLCKLRKQKPA